MARNQLGGQEGYACSRVLDAMERPRVQKLSRNLFAATFPIMKLITARHVLRDAEQLSALHEGSHVFESTSGTMGLALALACKERGYPLTLVGDYAIDPVLKTRIEKFGARVEIVDVPLAVGGMQAARLARLNQLMQSAAHPFWVEQYSRPSCKDGYARAAEEIQRVVGNVDFLVATVGTGGSGSGITRTLQKMGQDTRWAAVDTHGSILFGQPDRKRLLRGLGNSIIPKNLDYGLVDECHWVSAAEAYRATEHLYQNLLLDVGPTSGAAYLVAKWIASTHPNQDVVFICPDTGERYRYILDNSWRSLNGVQLDQLPSSPIAVIDPRMTPPVWSCMQWNGRPPMEALHAA